MSEDIIRLTVTVDQLRKGMYVVEPDRPWTDLPVLLQGFTIETDDQLRMLRKYCSHVSVDPERCAASVTERDLHAAATPSATARPHTRKRPATAESTDDGLDNVRRYPDPDRLRQQVHTTHRGLSHARSSVEGAFTRAERGDSVDVPAAGSTVRELIDRLTTNPTASMLLSSLSGRDGFTSTHCVNVCVLVLSFCLRTRLGKRQLEIIGLGTLLHDVGKARLPTELLNRPGPLSEEEWQAVRQHPIESERILADSGQMARGALDIARMHHERRDGKGYPDGRSQAQLPNHVLIAALINRYHSLTTPRPYRSAKAPDHVLQSFYRSADELYGSRAVESFIRCVGIYPMGSVVELDNGALGIVVTSRPNNRLRPTVQLVRTPDGEPYRKMVLLNLSAEAERRERSNRAAPARHVRRVHTPEESGIDPGAVIAESFGLQVG